MTVQECRTRTPDTLRTPPGDEVLTGVTVWNVYPPHRARTLDPRKPTRRPPSRPSSDFFERKAGRAVPADLNLQTLEGGRDDTRLLGKDLVAPELLKRLALSILALVGTVLSMGVVAVLAYGALWALARALPFEFCLAFGAVISAARTSAVTCEHHCSERFLRSEELDVVHFWQPWVPWGSCLLQPIRALSAG